MKVLDEDIEEAVRYSSLYCPIANALRRETGESHSVGPLGIFAVADLPNGLRDLALSAVPPRYHLGAKGIDYMHDWDMVGVAKPQTIVLVEGVA